MQYYNIKGKKGAIFADLKKKEVLLRSRRLEERVVRSILFRAAVASSSNTFPVAHTRPPTQQAILVFSPCSWFSIYSVGDIEA